MTTKTAEKKTDDRIELAWAHFSSPAWPERQAMLPTEMIVSSEQTKLFLGSVHGIACVFVENASYKQPARIPLTNVASFGELA